MIGLARSIVAASMARRSRARQRIAGGQLAPEASGPQGDAGHSQDLVGIADTGFQAPAAQIEPENGIGSHPHAGPLAIEAQPGFLLAAQERDGAAHDCLQPAQQTGPVGRVAEGGGGQCHHHVDAGFVGGRPEATNHPGGNRRSVGRHTTGAGHLGAEMEEGATPEDGNQHAVPSSVHHHEMERAASEIEDGNTYGRHRRDAIPLTGFARGVCPADASGGVHRSRRWRASPNLGCLESRSSGWRRHRGVAQLGSAPALGAGGRGFKSRRPDQVGLAPFRACLTSLPFRLASMAARSSTTWCARRL